MVLPSAPQSARVQPRTVATSVPLSPCSQSTLIGSCRQTDGFKPTRESPVSRAARCNVQPAPPSKPGRLRKMQAPSMTRVLLREASAKTPPSDAAAWCSKTRRLQCGRQGADQVRLVFVVEFCADRATTLAEFGGRFRQDPEAAATPNAGTVRGEERAVEPPSGVTVRSR